MSKIKIVLIEDHSLVLDGLKKLLGTVEKYEVVASCNTGAEGIMAVKEKHPDVCILDVRLPDLPSTRVLEEIRRNSPKTKVLCLSSFDSIYEIEELLMQGASGYIMKNITSENFFSAIDSVHQGGFVIDPQIARKLYEKKTRENKDIKAPLTRREMEVLNLIARGYSNMQIAVHLSIKEDTVKTHISNIFSKLNARNRVEAVAVALKNELIRLD